MPTADTTTADAFAASQREARESDRADLAALRAGCVLEELDGWHVPLAGGGVGWLPREAP